MKLKKLRKEKQKSTRTNKILFLLFCVITLSLTVGYSALNEELNISGEASFRVEEEIRITDLRLSETTNMGLENYKSKYSKNSITTGVTLPNIESTISYDVEIINSGTVSMWIDSITEEVKNNTNMEYVLEGLGVKELINPGEVKNFKLKIKYKEGTTLPSNTNLDMMLRFDFIKPVSTLAMGNSGASNTKFFNSGPITKESVESITFLPTIEVGEGAIGYWDASLNKDGTVIAWYTDIDNNNLYELNIGGIGEVYAPSDASSMFQNFSKLVSIEFGDVYNTKNTTLMSSMFNGCQVLKNLNLLNFNTEKVTNMNSMFSKCSKLAEINLSSFDTVNVVDMAGMFSMFQATSTSVLKTIIFGEKFNTSKVTTMRSMFYQCFALKTIDVSNFDTSNVTSMFHMFSQCSGLTKLDLSGFNTSKVTDMEELFYNCYNLSNLNISNFNTENVINMYKMFRGCRVLNYINLSSFDTSKVTNMDSMFMECSELTALDLSSFDTSKVTNMKSMFYNCSKLQILDISKFNTLNVTNMSYMFYYCKSLKELDLSNFNTSKVTNMSYMFNMVGDGVASSSTKTGLTSLDISSFDTSNVTNMSNMFNGCVSLQKLDVSRFNTSKVTSMFRMFAGLKTITSLNVTGFDTSRVTNMRGMFQYSSGLINLDLSNFDTSNVTNMYLMFDGCYNLKTLNLSSFNTSKVKYFGSMFNNCRSLELLDIRNLSFDSAIDKSNSMTIDNMFNGVLSSTVIYVNSEENKNNILNIKNDLTGIVIVES